MKTLMESRTCLAVILAAGEGTRMRSNLPKAMHPVGGLPMLGHVLATAARAGATRVAVVVGPDAAAVRAFVQTRAPQAAVYEQAERLGTAHAVLAADQELAAGLDDVLVLYGDTPLVTAETLQRLRGELATGAEIAVLGFRPADPAGYGRLVMDGDRLVAIREHKDASHAERAIGFCNAGVMAFSGASGPALLAKIGKANAAGHYYLTDLVELANAAGKRVAAIEAEADEVLGVNTRAELALVERVFQERTRRAAMLGGATLLVPETVTFSHDTVLGRDVVVEPNVFFAPGVTVGDGVTIRAFSHIEGAKIAAGAIIGPFARLRPGADIGEGAHIGNFVEIKNAVIDAGAKANHLSYIGDAHVGAATNIGAGTITCNYDGYGKYHTEIGANAFIGSNSALVAPVSIGDGAYVGSGSVITDDVPPDALALGRARQVVKPGRAAVLKARRGKK
jgi:bifunctional UDP-N-acetylglucosamine pyrophosphorylase / glucosamine-1-phosphate N-acetyltransferase